MLLVEAVAKIQKSQNDLALEVSKVVPIIQTIPALKQQIADLQAAIEASGNAPQEVSDAADAIEASITSIDNAVSSLTPGENTAGGQIGSAS